MTFRAKPVVKRTHRPSWETDTRRTVYLNLAFGGVVLVALLLLGGAAASSYYNDHFAPVAHVNGVAISKDDLTQRITADTWRLDYAESQLRQQVNLGHLAQADADQRIQTIDSQKQQVSSVALDELIDAALQTQLAGQQGITVSDQQVADALTQAATTPEQRHAWVIAVKPAVDKNATAPTDAQKAAAKQKADTILSELQAGQKWEDVAKKSSDDATAEQGGDLGYLYATDTSQEADFVAALFKLPANGLTPVLLGSDGTYRIGRVSDIAAKVVDANYQAKMQAAGVSLDTYKRLLKANLYSKALQDKVLARLTAQPSDQRHVLEIFLNAPTGTGDEVKARHILFSPNHSTDSTANKALKPDDPAWVKAKADAEAAYQQLVSGKATFADLAKKLSDDKQSGAQGGDLPWLTRDSVVKQFGDAIFGTDLKPNQILAPIKTDFGWHVIQFVERRPPAQSRIDTYQAQAAGGADFAQLAKDKSDGPEASKGGDIGWVARYQLDPQLEDAIFATKVGGVSSVVQTSSGFYLFKVVEEANRVPAGDQLTTLKDSGFNNWYNVQKAKASIQRNDAAVPAAS
ncbi:MAG TPA: peptidylprolyl isomerase [Candidatus Limnocylindrales bacterium]